MFRLLSFLMCLSFTISSFASETFDEIAAQKQFHKNIDAYQQQISSFEANSAFKADMIEKALSSNESSITEIEKSNLKNKQELIAKIEKDTEEKVALMQELDPQTIKDMAIMDIQKVQTSQNVIFFLTKGVIGKKGFSGERKTCKKWGGESCLPYGVMIAFSPVIFAITLGVDLALLPFTFIVSATTGF